MMHTLSIKYKKNINENELWHAFNQLLGSLRHNGQLIGREMIPYKDEGQICATIFTAAENALNKKCYNKYVKDGISLIERLSGKKIEIKYVGTTDDEIHSICKCKKYSYFVLRYYNQLSPILCGNCNKAIPLYKMPKLHDFGYWNVTSWQSNYMACVVLDVNCTVGEKWAIKQQCNAHSELSKQGRAVANSIKISTGVKTYYYLSNFSKKSKEKDMARPCPGCGGKWRLKAEIHDYVWFKCNKCLLMSGNVRP
jgi:predicted  nucleic acid-binding Zn ribbon protein